MNSIVTPHELAMALKRSFERMERNGDGLPTREKMLMDAPPMGSGGGESGGPGGPQRPRSGGRGPGRWPRNPAILKR